jgi:hypothetical protein
VTVLELARIPTPIEVYSSLFPGCADGQ